MYVKYRNNLDNKIFIHNDTQRKTSKSRHLAEIENPKNPHYHNDPELKEIIDKLNKEAIKKYQKTHEPYEQLQELVKKNRTKNTRKNNEQKMSIIEKELLKTYEEIFSDENYIMLKPGIYSNDKNDKFCEYTNKKDLYDKLSSSYKIHDNYLDNLKEGCVAGVGTCALSSIITGSCGIAAASKAAGAMIQPLSTQITNALIGVNFFYISSLETAIKSVIPVELSDFIVSSGMVTSAASAGTATFFSYGMTIVALIAITIIVIILYVWLRNRRKNSLKHECKKHLCT
ncbi:PIR protein, pseudogene, putative [Plasmodium sp.]|nr:PIR protein, pseudogene, putative [Plasmodium sp.]